MKREDFLDNVAARLGQVRPRGVTRPHVAIPTKLPRAASRVERFARELERVGGRLFVAESLADVAELLRAELDAVNVRSLVGFARSELAPWQLALVLAERGVHYCPEAGHAVGPASIAFREAVLRADAGVTTVDYGLIETGSLVISCCPTRPRAVSLVPRFHIALVREEQLVDDLGQALGTASNGRVPSAIQVITGPSRTSDIENDLTIGVHGPAAVRVLLLRSGPGYSGEAA